MRLPITLIAGSYGTGNLGDESILAGIVKILINDKNYSKKMLIVFSRDPEETFSFHGITAKRKNLVDLLSSQQVIIGGGELMQDLDHMALKYSTLGIIAKILRKHVSFYAIGISSIKSCIGKTLARLSLNIADEVSVRDPSSKHRLELLGIRRKVEIVDDPSVYVDPVSTEKATNLLKNEGIKVEEQKVLISLTTQHTFHIKFDEQLHNFLLDFLRHILAKYFCVDFIFIPFNDSKDCPLDRDVIYGKWLEKKLNTNRFKILHGKYKPEEIKGILSLFDLIISTRLHPLIFSSQANVPRIGVAVFEKIEGLGEREGFPTVKVNELKKLYNITEKIIERALAH